MREINIEGFTIGGDVHKRIKALEGLGYDAVRREENPHAFWQQAEHYKRSSKSNNKIMTNKTK